MSLFYSLLHSHHSDETVLFVSLWETTGPNETIQFPVSNLYTIDWGDGSPITTTETSHEYVTAGNHIISSPDTITDFMFSNSGDVGKIRGISSLGGLQILSSAFHGASDFDITATDIPAIIGDNLTALFNGTGSLIFNSSINDWDTSSVKFFNSMFTASSFNQVINGWDTSQLTTTTSMFFQTGYNQPLNNWDVSSLVTSTAMFRSNPAFNQPLDNWVTTSLVTANLMFSGATSFNQDISPWDMSSASVINNMFQSATAFDQDISPWDFSSVTNISGFMQNKTSANYSAANYDALLIKWDNAVGGLVFGNMTNVNIGMGTIKYTDIELVPGVSGSIARANLVTKGFIITDGGLV